MDFKFLTWRHPTTSFIAITLIELPSVIVLILLMDIWGRKPLLVKLKTIMCLAFGELQCTQCQVASLILPGASCIAAGLLEKVSIQIQPTFIEMNGIL